MTYKSRFTLLFSVAIISIGYIVSSQAAKPISQSDISVYGGPLSGNEYACNVTNVSEQPVDITITVYCMVGSSFCLSKEQPPTDLVDDFHEETISPGQSTRLTFSNEQTNKPYRCKVDYLGKSGSLRGTFCTWSTGVEVGTCVSLAE